MTSCSRRRRRCWTTGLYGENSFLDGQGGLALRRQGHDRLWVYGPSGGQSDVVEVKFGTIIRVLVKMASCRPSAANSRHDAISAYGTGDQQLTGGSGNDQFNTGSGDERSRQALATIRSTRQPAAIP